MNRQTILQYIATTVVHGTNANVAVLLSSLDEVIRFNSDLKQVLGEIPVWMMPILIQHTRHNFIFECGRIDIVNCDTRLRSRSFSLILKSSLLTPEKKREYSETELIHVILTGSTNTIIEFEDE